MLKTAPAVFAVGNNYQIMVPVTGESLMWVKVGDKCYYDHSNGIMRSLGGIHRMTVPMRLLDEAGGYTVCEKVLIQRKPYFPESEDTVETYYSFYPVPTEGAVRAYHIADAHNDSVKTVQAAKVFGDIHLLIMNGDIPDHSGATENFDTIYDIAARVTGGERPVVFVRGNHDLRGFYAEKIADYTPNMNGQTYYTFRLGNIWGIALDCGEDKDDSHAEYGCTVSCHAFREEETEFINRVIANADREYLAPGVTRRLVIVHNPFTHQLESPFDIEAQIYSSWAKKLADHIKPHLMICGHLHSIGIHMPGSEFDHLGQPCPVVVGARPSKELYTGAGFEFDADRTRVTFTHSDGTADKPVTIEHI